MMALEHARELAAIVAPLLLLLQTRNYRDRQTGGIHDVRSSDGTMQYSYK